MNTSSQAAAPAEKNSPREPKRFLYTWEGKNAKGRVLRGQIHAISQGAVSSALREHGISPTRIVRVKTPRGQAINERQIAFFTRQLSTMLRSGIAIIQALDIIAKGHSNPNFATLIQQIKADVETGMALSDAFRKHPKHFDDLYCNLIAAGEQGGILDDLLDRLATYKEKILALKGTIKSALFYPISVLVVAFAVTAVLMVFVIPSFKQVFDNFGAELPAATSMVIAISDACVEYWYLFFGLPILAVFLYLRALRSSVNVQRATDAWLLRAPVFGALIRKATIARWCRTLATMFSAGTPLVEAMESVGGASGNWVYRDATVEIGNAVREGASLAMAMQSAQIFDSMVLQMVQIGEETGALDSMLGKVSDFYEREVDDTVASLSSLLEPIIIVVLGVLIGGMVIAMYLPIFKMGQVV